MHGYSSNMYSASMLNVQRYPDDAEFLNQEINHFDWMLILFGAHPDMGYQHGHSYAQQLKREMRQAKYGGSSKAKNGGASNAKSGGASKAKSGRASKAVAEEDSDDDFMPRRVSNKKCNNVRASKAVADENSDDDFMTLPRTHGRSKGSR